MTKYFLPAFARSNESNFVIDCVAAVLLQASALIQRSRISARGELA
jgi:hypothetical protein